MAQDTDNVSPDVPHFSRFVDAMRAYMQAEQQAESYAAGSQAKDRFMDMAKYELRTNLESMGLGPYIDFSEK